MKKQKQSKAEEFGQKIALAMLEISSSHVYFIIQQAYKGKEWGKYGELMSWEDVVRILKEVLHKT